jgi:hypothetical protein
MIDQFFPICDLYVRRKAMPAPHGHRAFVASKIKHFSSSNPMFSGRNNIMQNEDDERYGTMKLTAPLFSSTWMEPGRRNRSNLFVDMDGTRSRQSQEPLHSLTCIAPRRQPSLEFEQTKLFRFCKRAKQNSSGDIAFKRTSVQWVSRNILQT